MSTADLPDPNPPRPPSDWGRLVVLVLLAIGLRGYTIANTTVPSRDCIVFVRDGLQLETPPDNKSRREVVKAVEHPPGYPAALIAMSWLIRPAAGPTVESMALGAQLVSAIAGTLLVFPLFFLTRRLFDRNAAFAAVAIFLVLPVCVEVTSDGISDGLFLLTSAWALWFAVRALEQNGWKDSFLFGLPAGLCCGLGYLFRPDSAIVATGIGLTFAGLVVRRLLTGSWIRPFAAGLGLVVGAAVFVGPYVATIGKLTNKPSGEGMLDALQFREPDPTFFDRSRDHSARPGVRLLLAEWLPPGSTEWKPAWAIKALWREYTKAAHYAVPGFALIGLLALGRRRTDPRIALIIVSLLFHLTVLWLLAWKIGYVSQRHTLCSVMLTCIFAGVGLPVVGAWGLRRFGSSRPAWQAGAVLAVLFIAVAIPRDLKSLHYERAGHKAAGKWLADYGDPDYQVVDPFGWAEWYSGRSLYQRTLPKVTQGSFLYAVYEPNAKSPHSRLPLFFSAGAMSKTGEIVFQYPEGVPPEQIKVAVYKSPPLLKVPE